MRGRWPYLMLLVAIGLGLATTYLAYRWMERQTEARPKGGEGLLLKSVVVAGVDMAPGTKLSVGSLKVIKWPWDSVPKTAANEPSQLVDRVVLVPIAAGEPVLESKLAAQGMEGGLTAIISAGKRALSVKVDEIIGVAGFVMPGTRVDVLVTLEDKQNRKVDATAQTILQNIKVLTSGQKVMQEKEKPVLVNVVTLEVTLEEAEKLALAANRGRIQLALRNQTDEEEIITRGINTPQLIARPKPVKAAAPKAVRKAPAVDKRDQVIIEVIRGDKRTKQVF
jgi:pilus assembly protein CpaB